MTYAYHWSPAYNHDSIIKRGLLVPKDHPRLTTPVTCSEGHRNPHISLGRTPLHAWELSGGFLKDCTERDFALKWDLWQVDIGPTRKWREDDHEYASTKDIAPQWVTYLATRSMLEHA
ncbi:hypothetical protein HWC80_gp069 [Mycobacterium phage Indlulamithi]|uniref:Uncharacterized protein n=1 Tax=Mycobacterium phage Indlulamithi TaxID=2656582 RepID=A0A649VDW1_9CAUD|nr:hypothetical protein HWC80_gp069 [Mycobacterium phage Indlulamithi]QGJ90142.1 hypothetical protein PBI_INDLULAMITHI_105 [Mycobacterium phage Indlulamithi]